VLAGYTLGESWYPVEDYASVLQWVAVIGAVVAVAAFAAVRLRSRARAAGD
jgi:membrane protein DedA with SNARE-associated domain